MMTGDAVEHNPERHQSTRPFLMQLTLCMWSHRMQSGSFPPVSAVTIKMKPLFEPNILKVHSEHNR